MKGFLFRKLKKERGSISIIAAISITVLMAFSAIVIDVGRVALEKQALQNALDAASLAGAKELPDNLPAAREMAISFFVQNGFSSAAIQNIDFSNSNKRIKITASQPVEYTFAKIFENGDNTTVTVSASAQISSVFDPFKYTLFSGSGIDLLQFKGSNIITGNVHSNNSIKNAAEVSGIVTAVNTIDARVSASGGKIEGAAFVDMPDFTDVLNLASSLDPNTLINVFGASYDTNKSMYTLSDTQLNDLLSSYPIASINGNLTVNGSGINATGSIMTTGNVVFNGGNVNMGISDSVCFYSINGSITLNGGNGNVNGILYAPKGTVALNGSGGVFYGSIVGDLVTCDGGINLTYNQQVAGSLPLTITRLVE